MMYVITLGIAVAVSRVTGLSLQHVDGVLCIRGQTEQALVICEDTRCVYAVGPRVIGEWRRLDKILSW